MLSDGKLLIENLYDVGKIKVRQEQSAIEPDLVYPLLRGRDVQRWQATPSTHIILTQDPKTRKGIPEAEMKRCWPNTYAYLKRFEEKLRDRAGFKKFFNSTAPFYSIYNVGPYTIAEWKVVWREQSSSFQAAFAGFKSQQVIVPDHKLMLVPCISEQEAHFLLGMLNSSPSVLAVHSYAIPTSTSTHVLNNVAIPRFTKTDLNHTRLAELSRQCHVAAKQSRENRLTRLEAEIDEVAAKIWGITDAELKAIREALPEK